MNALTRGGQRAEAYAERCRRLAGQHREFLTEGGENLTHHHSIIVTMERELSGPFLLLLLLLFLLFLCTPASGLGLVRGNYFYTENHYTWQDAQSYCRRFSYNADLAVMYKQSDSDNMDLTKYHAWIGLHRTPYSSAESRSWIWSDGQDTNFRSWASHEPYYSEDCAFISSPNKKFYGIGCDVRSFVICQPQRSRYKFVPVSMTWPDAQEFCRAEYQDLATFKSDSEVDDGVLPQDFPVWTGLYRDATSWRWSKGQSAYRAWAPGEPSGRGDCVSVSSLTKRMSTQNCSASFPVVCFWDNLVLVKENKTWEEALEHCRALKSPRFYGISHELLSVQPGTEHNYTMNTVMEADTEEVWTGLRFLAGDWLWVNRADLLYSDLPNCPDERRHCGTLSKNNTGRVETRDCTERRNFLCHSWW